MNKSFFRDSLNEAADRFRAALEESIKEIQYGPNIIDATCREVVDIPELTEGEE